MSTNSWYTVARMLDETGLSKSTFYKVLKELGITSRKTSKGRVVYLQEDLDRIIEYLDEEEEYLLPLDSQPSNDTPKVKKTLKKNEEEKQEEPSILDFGSFRINLETKDTYTKAELLECWYIYNDTSLPEVQRNKAKRRADNLTT